MDFTFAQLSAPFDYEDIEWRAGATNKEKTKALALAYITSRAVMNRLDEVCGPQNWKDEYAAGPDGGVVCGLSIRVNDEWITKWDGAENSNIEAVKGGLSDAFKRAAVKWGIGRYLYGLEGVWVKCELRGNTVVLSKDDQPKLPAWALPKGSKPAQGTTTNPPTNGNGSKPAAAPVDPIAQAEDTNTASGKRLGDLPTDKLKQFRALVETSRKEGKTIKAADEAAYTAAGVLIDHRDKQPA